MIPDLDILSIIPQRPPFVMVDRLINCDDKLSTTSLLVTPQNVLVDNGLLTEAGLVENMAQTAAAGAGYTALQKGGSVANGFIGAIRNLEVFDLPQVGDLLETRVEIEESVFDVTLIVGTVTCNGKLLASCKIKIFVQPSA